MFDELNREVFSAGEQIFVVGDQGDCAYVIESGSVEVFINNQGTELLLSALGKGELFGEIALIDHQPRTANVRAAEKTVLIPVARKLLEGLLDKSDPILRHLLLVILDRFRSKQSSSPKTVTNPPMSLEQSLSRNALKGEATKKLLLAHGITRALTHEEFQLYYQPLCNLSDGCIAGFEALIRWHHPTDGVIPPMDFLWIAEQTGLIRDLGLWTLERASRDWQQLKQYTHYEFPFVSVNLSPNQLICESLVDDIRKIIVRNEMPAHELKLELTETVIVEHPEIALRILDRLVELGSSFALDDYGTGNSGLTHLQRYPIVTLKIDRIFIAPMLESAQSMEIVRSSIDMAHRLGMNVVAEGVENQAVHQKLQELGCDYGQGWHYGRPAALHDLAARYNPDLSFMDV
jgi:diguanylate cyclase